MSRPFHGLVAWIPGGGTGIGAALARQLAHQGATVIVSGRRRDPLDRVVRHITEAGGTAWAEPCDITVDAQVEAVVSTILDRVGRLDIAIAAAGYAASGAVADLDARAWKQQFDVNVLGTVSIARHALPALRETRGRLVLIGSVVAFLGLPKNGAYAASKAAVAALGRSLAAEVAADGVSVTVVHPGFVESDIARVDALGRPDPGRKDRRPRWLLWKADDAAAVILDAAWRRERERVFTGHGRLAAALGRHAPALADRLVAPRSRAPRTPPADAGPLDLTPVPPIALARMPGTVRTFGGALLRAPGRPQGVVAGSAFPALSAQVVGVVVDRARVAAYRRVCSVPGSDGVLPIAMPEVLFLGVMGRLVLDPRFPLSPFGLIHTGQTITQHAPLRAGEPADLTARVASAARTAKGIELDVHLAADVGGQRRWEGVVTFLSRNASTQRVHGKDRAPAAPPRTGGVPIEAPGDTGLAYARVSGDHNPHHLTPWTARPLGYPKPIAHGMWTLARVLALAPAEALAEPVHVDVRFKRPLFLPGLMHAEVAAEPDGSWRMDAWNPRSGAPHLAGTLTRADAP